MHGLIFQQLQQFVTVNHGASQWHNILTSVGLGGKMYMPTQVYNDNEVAAIVSKASEVSQVSVPQVLEAFGEFMAPSLLKVYSSSIRPEWNTIDLLENAESTIHKAVRFADKKATPPKLSCHRVSTKVIRIQYSSPRKMIEVGIGIIKAIAKHKKETISIARKDDDKGTELEVSLM